MHRSSTSALPLLIALFLAALPACNNLTDLDAIMQRPVADAGIEDESANGGSDADLANNNRIPSDDAGGLADAPTDASPGEDVDPPDAAPDTSTAEDAGVDVAQDPLPDVEADVAPDAPREVCSEDQLASCLAPHCMEIASCAPETGQCTYTPSSSCGAQGEPCGGDLECFNRACGGDGVCGGAGATCGDQSDCISGTGCTAGVCERLTTGAMVQVGAGAFLRGDEAVDNSSPSGMVWLDAFWIDRTEVTVGAYAACVDAEVCTPPSTMNAGSCSTGAGLNNWPHLASRGLHPVNCVDWYQAAAYCAWAGRRLPTEAEWEKAARGTSGRTYPWGEATPSCVYAVMDESVVDQLQSGCDTGTTNPVSTKLMGASSYGAMDMAGNVAEWVADWYAGGYETAEETNPQGPINGAERVYRDGSFANTGESLVSARRHERSPDMPMFRLGFRCARSAP